MPTTFETGSTTTSGSTAIVSYQEGVTTGAGGPIQVSQSDIANLITQACIEGAMGASDNENSNEDEWTGMQIALASATLILGAAAMDQAFVALYRRLVLYERALDHEQVCKLKLFFLNFGDLVIK